MARSIHSSLPELEQELSRARELEAAGKERLDAQEKRVARLKVENVRNPESERVLNAMRVTHHLHGSHVRLLEREVREARGQKLAEQDTANQMRQNASACEIAALSVQDSAAAITFRDLAQQWRRLAKMTQRILRAKLDTRG